MVQWLPVFANPEPARTTIVLRARPPPPPSDSAKLCQVGRFSYTGHLPESHVGVLDCLDRYFDDDRLRRVRRSVQQRRADGAPTVSLRILDWLVVNYSKKRLLTCQTPGEPRDLHNLYREALDFYGRPLFDPFRRGLRVQYTLDGQAEDTTVGQLNFFHFMLRSGVLDCALGDSRAIERDMIATQARAKELRDVLGAKRRRVELTPSDPCRFHVVRHRDQRPPAVGASAVTAPAVTAPAVTAPAVTAPAVGASAVAAPAVAPKVLPAGFEPATLSLRATCSSH